MGQCLSVAENAVQVAASGGTGGNMALIHNDYELVIRSSKELEYILVHSFGARGKGLHEYTDSCAHMLSPELKRKMHFLATIRNKLVHEYGFNSIPDRTKFLNNFQSAQRELGAILQQHGKAPPPQGDFCRIS